MEFFKPGSLKIDFVGKRRPFVVLSIALVVASIILVFVKQVAGTINWGIDFAGGTVIDMEFGQEVDIGKIRKTVTDLGYEKNVIQRSGLGGEKGKSEFIIRVQRIAILNDKTTVLLLYELYSAFNHKSVLDRCMTVQRNRGSSFHAEITEHTLIIV